MEKREVYQHGRGVLDGCMLGIADGGGLFVQCSAGIVCVESAQSIARELGIPVPPNSTSYIWRSETGQTLVTSTPNSVGGLFVCVGSVVTSTFHVESIGGTGRMEPARMDPDNPSSFVVRSEILPKGPMHNPVAERFIDEDLYLEPTDRNIQIIDPGIADVRVFVFDAPHFGNWFRIANNGEPGDGTIAVQHGGNVLASLAPGACVDLAVKPGPRARMSQKDKTKHRNAAPDAKTRMANKYKSRDRNEWFVLHIEEI